MSGVVVGRQAARRRASSGSCSIDKAGGIGGTWYWNRYPGVMCDVESYIYMPMLEEMDYVPTTRYAFGDEIRRHLDAIATKYDLVDDALFHTGVDTSRVGRGSGALGDPHRPGRRGPCPLPRRWRRGILNLMKLPAIPGMDDFEGAAFHTARWDYELHRRRPGRPAPRPSSPTRSSASSASGASGIQAVPPLARVGEARVRVPAHAVGHRRARQPARPTTDFAERLAARAGSGSGWRTSRRHDRASGRRDLVDDGWTLHTARSQQPASRTGMSVDEYIAAHGRGVRLRDDGGAPRSGSSELVADPAVAEMLKPYYRYLCKRPCFHDEYLAAFNHPNVTLVDCPAGVERITEQGAVVDGTEYELDCIVYATGFEAELTPFAAPGRPRHHRPGRHHDGREVDGRRHQPARHDDARLPEHVHHAGARPAGRRHRQLHAPDGPRRRAHRGARSRCSRSAASRCST